MNAEEMEIARRFAACEQWGPVDGMHGFDAAGEPVVWSDVHGCVDDCGDVSEEGREDVLPNLAHTLTRAGMLEVVRRAWRDETACIRWACRDPFTALWVWEAGEGTDRQTGWAESELAALLAALEAAPGV